MADQRTLQDLAKQSEHFINPDTLSAFSFEICMRSVMDKQFVSTVLAYLTELFVRCRERHGGVVVDYSYENFFICPIVCAFPDRCFRVPRTDDNDLPDSVPESLADAIQSGKRYSAKLVEITELFLVGETVDFCDIPDTVTEGFTELINGFYEKYTVWKCTWTSSLVGKALHVVHKLENVSVMHENDVLKSRAYSMVEKLRNHVFMTLGSDMLEMLDADVVNGLKNIAIKTHALRKRTVDMEMRSQQTLIIFHACTRIKHYSGSDALQAFIDQHLPE